MIFLCVTATDMALIRILTLLLMNLELRERKKKWGGGGWWKWEGERERERWRKGGRMGGREEERERRKEERKPIPWSGKFLALGGKIVPMKMRSQIERFSGKRSKGKESYIKTEMQSLVGHLNFICRVIFMPFSHSHSRSKED